MKEEYLIVIKLDNYILVRVADKLFVVIEVKVNDLSLLE